VGSAGLALGWFIGSLIEFERWEAVALPRRMSVVPARGGGVTVSLRLTF
jgi:hypothetical protein